MDERTLSRLHAEQVESLRLLAAGRPPRGAALSPGALEAAEHVQEKYIGHVLKILGGAFPTFSRLRRLTPAKIAAVFRGKGLDADRFQAIDDVFRVLLRLVARGPAAPAWRDLLLIERGRALARNTRGVPRRAATNALKSSVDRGVTFDDDFDGCFVVWLSTDLVYGFPDEEPSAAKVRKGGSLHGVIFKNEKTGRVQLILGA